MVDNLEIKTFELGKRDQVLDRGQTRNGTALSSISIHDTGFHLHRSIRRWCKSMARIKQRISFQFFNLFFFSCASLYIYIYIYIYKTESFEPSTIFHVIIIFKILAL